MASAMRPLMVQAIGVLVALVFCVVRLVIDIRARRFGWVLAGLVVSGLLIWAALVSVPTHAVKIDLPVRN